MAQTLDQINALRSFKGEEPLTEIPKEEVVVEIPSAEQSKEAPIVEEEKKEVEQPKQETPKEEIKPTIVAEEKKEQPTVIAPTELDDEAILEALKKRGINVASFEELTPKETIDPEKAAEQREAAKLSFALSKGLYSKKEYENYVRDSNDLQNLVYGEFYKDAKKENADLTNEEIQEAFLSEYGLDADPDSTRYKRGVNTVALLADRLLKEKYGKIYTTDQEFDQYESVEKSKKELHNKILLKAPSYRKDVEDVLKDLNKVIIPFDENESFEVEFSKNALDNLRNQLLEENYSLDRIKNGWDKENLKQVGYAALTNMDLVNLVKEVSKQYLYKHQKGTKGIPTTEKNAAPVDELGHLTDNQKLALSYFKGEVSQEANAN